MGKQRTFKVGDTTYDVPEDKAEGFLSRKPDAIEVSSFIVDKDTFDVPLDKVEGFLSRKPNAKPLGEPVAAPTPSQEIPTITLDSTEVAEGTAEAPKPPTGPLKPGGGFTIGEQPKPPTGPLKPGGGFTIGKTPTLTKQTKDIFVKNFLELPDNLKLDARNSGVFVNTFAKKMNLSPRELRQVANETVKTEVQLKQLKTIYDQNPDDTDTLYKLAELHNNLGQHDLAYEAYAALEGKLKTIGEKEYADRISKEPVYTKPLPLNFVEQMPHANRLKSGNLRPDYVEQRQLPAVAGMAYTQELLGNKAEAQRLKGISESRGYKGQEFSSVGAGEALQPGNDMVYNDQGQMVPVGSPTPESEYLNDIAQAIENFTLFGPANEMTNVGFDKLAKNLPGAFDPYGLPSDKIAKTVGVITGAVETLMGVAGMTTPAGALFAMPLVEVQNVAPEVAKWMMPLGVVLNEYYRQQGEKMPEMMENVTVLADLGILGFLTHQGVEGAKGLKAEIDLKKVFENPTPEAVEQLAKVGEKRIEMAQGDPKVYGEQMALRLDKLKPQVEEIKMQAEAAKPVEPYNPPPHPESLRTVEEGASIVMNGEEGILERGNDGTWYHTTDKKSTQIKVEDKFNPTETLKELGIEVLAEITPEQVARATADAEQVGRVEMNGKEYFVSLDRVGNENPTGDFVLEVKPDGTMINRFDSHPDPTFAKERKLKVINTFLESKGLPKRDKLTSTKLVEETPTQEKPSTSEIKPIENEKANQEGREEGLLDTPPLEQPLAPVAEKPTPNEPVSPAVEVQIEDFGVPKSDVGAVKSLLDNVFAGLKKAGLTAFKTLDEWIGIGKGEAKEQALLKQQEFGGFVTRDGTPVGFKYDVDKVARERFNFSDLKQIGKGSDRSVFDLGDGKVLKVAHSARGLEQNIYEGDYYLKGIVPEVYERGLNYVVVEKVSSPAANKIELYREHIAEEFDKAGFTIGEQGGMLYMENTKTQEAVGPNDLPTPLRKLAKDYGYLIGDSEYKNRTIDYSPVIKKIQQQNTNSVYIDDLLSDLKKFSQKDFDNKNFKLQEVLEKYELSDILSYDVLWGDFIAKRNWGIKDGSPIHLDGGTFGGVKMLTSHKGKTNLSDPEFRKIYEESKALKKQFGDTDKATMYKKAGGEVQAQYHIQSGKNIIEAIKNFNGSKKATVAITHEIMHPTVVAIIDGAKSGVEKGIKHTDTIVSEYNKAKGKKITAQELIEGNDAFKEGKTSDTYRAVQEFIADSWEKYHREGGKGFSESFQKVLEQITQAFTDVYKTLKGKELTPELRKMFDEILGKEPEPVKVKEPRVESEIETKVRELKQDVLNIGYEIGHEMEKNSLAEFSPDMYAVQNMPWIKPESAAKETGGRVGSKGDINPSMTNASKGVTVSRAGEILANRASEDGLHPFLDSEDWRAIVIDILHAGSKESYVKNNTKFGKERTRALKQDMAEKKAELAQAIKDLENADWEKLGFDSKKEFKQHVRDIKQGKQIDQYEMDAMDVVAQMDDAAVDRMLKELDENYPITEEEINKFYEKHNIEEGSVSAEVSSTEITEGNTAEGKAKKTGEGELTPDTPLKITSKEKALKAVDDLENFLLNLPGIKDNVGGERMGAPFSAEEAVKFFAEALREGVEQGYKVKEAIERAIGKLKEHKTYKALLDSVDESMLRDNARKNYEKQGVSLDKPIEQQFGASHASVAEVRKVMGLTDEINITDAHKRDTKTVMKEGKQIAESSNVQFLADDIISGEKIPNAQEQAALVYEQTKLYNESLDYQDRINSFTEKGELNAADQATIELANIRARQKNVMDALDVAGTKMGLAFRMRQLINKRDHSLVALEKRWTSASGGNEITPSVRKQLEARVKELEAEVKKSEELFKAKDKELADQAMLDIQEALAREKTSPLQRIKAEKKARKQELAQKFRGVFNDATNIAKAMVDKEFYEYARLVLEEAAGDFKEFSKRMIGDLGKNVEPHLQEIFDKASKKEYEKAFVDEVKGIQIDKQLIRDIVEQGVKDSQELVDKVFDAVKDDLPEGTSRREVQDAISEYGKQINPKIDPLQAEINSLKRDLKLESGLEDATSGKGVKRSGFTQPKPTPKQRGLKRRINEELKNYPQDQTEVNKKWATALDRTKTALNNSITDLTKRLDDLKQGIATAKTPKERVKLDADAQALKDMRDDLVKQIEEIEGKKKLSYEQRVILAIEAAERTAQKYKNRTEEIKKTGTYSKDTPTQLSSPELDIARAKRDAAQAEFNQASKDANLDVIAATSKALRDSQDRVAKLEQKVRSNDISYAQRAVRLAIETPEIKASKAAEKALRDIIDTMREEQGLAELHRMELWKNRAANRLKELERRVREKDYSKKVKKETPIDMEMERTAMKIDRAKFDLDVAIEVERYKNLQGWEKVGETVSDIFNIPKSIMASMDISAPFRQGAVLFARHPILGVKATKEMFKHLWSEKEANDWNDRLRLSDGYIRAKKSNLFISEPMARLVASEERFMSHMAEKIPVIGRGVKASNRAYSGFLNKIRTDVFNQHYEALVNEGFSGKELQSELSQMAHLINNFSGRGKLGKRGELASPLLNAAFFAPRYVTSRINTLANAVTGYWLEGRAYGSQRMSTRTRIEAYKALGAYVTVGVGVLQMAKAAGAEVEIDPRSSDFGKIKIGDLRYDIWAGFQQEIVLLARIFTQAKVDVFNGKVKKFNEGFGSSNTGSTVGNFLRSKASPQVGYALSAMTGTTMGMEEFDAGKELLRMSVPLLLQDPIANLIYNDAVSMYKEGDAGIGTFAASATGVGVGYIPKPKAVEDANLKERSLNLMIGKQYKPQDYKDDEVYVKGKPYIIPEDKMVKIKEMRAKEAGKLIENNYWTLKKLTDEEYESKVNSYYNEGLKKARNKYLPSGWKNTK